MEIAAVVSQGLCATTDQGRKNLRCIAEVLVVRGGHPTVNHAAPKSGKLTEFDGTFGRSSGKGPSTLAVTTPAKALFFFAAGAGRVDLTATYVDLGARFDAAQALAVGEGIKPIPTALRPLQEGFRLGP